MSQMRALIQREQTKRDRRIKRWIALNMGPTAIGKKLGVSRQRAQQLIDRLS